MTNIFQFLLEDGCCDPGTWYSLIWYGLEYVFSYICTGLVFQVSSVTLKSNSYFLHILWSIAFSSDKCFLSGVTLNRSDFWYWYSRMRYVRHVPPNTWFLSRSYLYWKLSSLSWLEDELNLFLVLLSLGQYTLYLCLYFT